MTGNSTVDLCVALSTVVALGYAVLCVVAPKAPFFWFERLALAFPLGWGVLSGIWLLLTPLYGVVRPVWAVSVIAWLLSIWGARAMVSRRTRRRAGTRITWRGWSTWANAAGAILLALEFSVMILAALHTPLGWDGLFNFELKARLLFDHPHSGQVPLAYFSDASRGWSHPRYPLLVPFAEFWVYSWLGHVDQMSIKILFPLFFIALVGSVCGTIRRLTSGGAALACGVSLGLLPALTAGSGATTGDADVPLAACIAAALCCGLLAIRTNEVRMFALTGLIAACAAWTKVEGLLLALCLGSAVLAVWIGRVPHVAKNKIPVAAASCVVWLPLLVMLPWWIVQHFYGMPEPDFPSLSLTQAIHNIVRLPVVAGLVLREFVTPGHWGVLWPAFIVTSASAARRRQWTFVEIVLLATTVIPMVVYTAAYFFSSWTNVADHVRTSFERLLIPLAPIALIFIAAQLWRDAAPHSQSVRDSFAHA